MSSLEGLSSTANGGRRRSGPLRRRLLLLQKVLPHFPVSLAITYVTAKRSDKPFWNKFLNQCTAMDLDQWRFDRIDDTHGELVETVLDNLEKTVDMNEVDIAEESRSSCYSRLETLRKEIKSKPEGSEPFFFGLLMPQTDDECEWLVGSLKRLSSVINEHAEQPPPEDLPVMSTSKPLMGPLLLSLFSTVSEYWRCTCKPHKAALPLFTNRTLPKDECLATFTVLLSRSTVPRPTQRWQETAITVCEDLPKKGVRIMLPNSTTSKKSPVTDLCAMTKKNRDRLNLKVDGASLSSHSGTEIQATNFHECELISLREGLLENEEGILGPRAKVCLAVILSYAFLDFCGKPWFPGGWNKNSLQLMYRKGMVFLQPFLVTDMTPKRKDLKFKQLAASIRATKLLHHGILLMEVFQQDVFNFGSEIGVNGESLKNLAKERFKSIKWGVSERFGKAVEECIEGELVDSARLSPAIASKDKIGLPTITSETTPEVSDEEFARLFCNRILALLEADFESHWQGKDPDQVITTLTLSCARPQRPNTSRNSGATPSRASTPSRALTPSRTATPSRALTSSRTPTPHRSAIPNRTPNSQLSTLIQSKSTPMFSHTVSQHLKQASPSPKISYVGSRRPNHASSVSGLFNTQDTSIRFFDAEELPDIVQMKGAKRWFANFDDSEIQKRLPKSAASKGRKIKIATLDTGIDMSNTWIRQRRGRIQCWPAGSDCDDKDGHGTHVAHLLLRLAPHIHLRICKVSNTRLLKDADVTQITKAISHFSAGDGKVDIINLSFGFRKYKSNLGPILTTIRSARNNGVIIFAAAGNDGGNHGVFWPAALHVGGDVIRINASDGDGDASGCNPDIETAWDCISTLGEGVPSCQLDSSNQEVIHRSGTSFATPIAAAIAAIVLGFADNADWSEYADAEELLPRLRTALGMGKVLCQACVRQPGSKRSGFSYITPWYFLKVEEKIRASYILRALEDVPESPSSYVTDVEVGGQG